MGTDNLFKKHKAKTARNLQRRKNQRDSYEKILIVCEGEKTEPNYLKGVRNHYSLNTANVEICGNCSSDPMEIVKYAKKRFREEKDAGDAFDKVFCVFDKDSHSSYAEAVSALNSATPKGTFTAVTSVPSFEYWPLLHFIYTTRPYEPQPGNSAGNQVLSELRQYMPDYEKGQKDIFDRLLPQLDQAKNYAMRALKAAERNGTDNPSTRVHELVEFMQKIKEN